MAKLSEVKQAFCSMYNQQEGVNYDDTIAPLARFEAYVAIKA